MKVCIVRHGSAEAGVDSDESRSLTEKGFQQAQGVGRWIGSLIEDQQLSDSLQICHSPFLRARQTAEAVSEACGLKAIEIGLITPSGDIEQLLEWLMTQDRDVVLVSHLPLVGRLAAKLVEGQVFDQPWSPAEAWVLEGDMAASGCMTVTKVWYPALEEG